MTTQVQISDQDADNRRRVPLWIQYIIVLLFVGALYGFSVAPGALWQDNGMAQVRVLQHDYFGSLGLALAHPLFYLLAQIFQWLPFRESAYKTNLVAAVFGMLTVANVYVLLNLLLVQTSVRRPSAVLATLSLAIAHTFWQHAALAEVYTVSTFLLTCELLALVQFVHTQRVGWWLAVFFLNGLECANHVLALVTLAAIVIWSGFLIYSRQIPREKILPASGLWLLGCLPYLILGLWTWWGGTPFGTVLKSMLFGAYRSEVLNTHLSFRLLIMAIGVIGLNFLTPNIALIPAGVLTGRKFIVASLYNFLLLATVLHLAFAVRYPVRDQYTFFIIPVLFLSIWLGLGAAWFFTRWSARWIVPLILIALISPVAYIFIPRVIHRVAPNFAYPPVPYRDAAEFFFWPWKTGYRGADRLASEVFALAGPDAIVIADSTSERPIVYHQLADDKRTDIIVAADLFGQIPSAEKVRKLTDELKRRQVFIVRPYPGYTPDWILNNFKIVPAGPIYRVQGPAS